MPLLKTLTADVSVRYDALPEHRRRFGLQAHLQGRAGVPAGRHAADPRQLRHRVPRAGHGLHLHRRQRLLLATKPISTSARSTRPTARSTSGVSVEGNQIGNPDLKSINARSFGFGVVWSPSSDFDLRADYYNISIEDEVVPQSTDPDPVRRERMPAGPARHHVGALRGRVVARRSAARSTRRIRCSARTSTKIIVRPINIAEENVVGHHRRRQLPLRDRDRQVQRRPRLQRDPGARDPDLPRPAGLRRVLDRARR